MDRIPCAGYPSDQPCDSEATTRRDFDDIPGVPLCDLCAALVDARARAH